MNRPKSFLTFGLIGTICLPLATVVCCVEQEIELVVQNLNQETQELQNLVDPTQTPSQIPESYVKEEIAKIEGLENIDKDNIFIDPADETGVLTITIKNYGEDKVIELEGFGTISNVVQSLTKDTNELSELIDPGLTADLIIQTGVLEKALKSVPGLSQIDMANVESSTWENETQGYLAITILNYGENLKIELAGFATTDQFKSFNLLLGQMLFTSPTVSILDYQIITDFFGDPSTTYASDVKLEDVKAFFEKYKSTLNYFLSTILEFEFSLIETELSRLVEEISIEPNDKKGELKIILDLSLVSLVSLFFDTKDGKYIITLTGFKT